MSEEEAAIRVVGVGGRLAELVVDPVVPRPHEDRVLHRDAVRQHQEYPQRKRGLVGSVRPEAMRPRCYALESVIQETQPGTDFGHQVRSI